MATDIFLMRQGNMLSGVDPSSMDAISAMAHGEMVTATIRRTRNAPHHRKFFALLNEVFENQDRYPTLEHLLEAVKIGIGHFDSRTVQINGIVMEVCVPRSIAFAKMDQPAFEQFYDRAIIYIIKDVIPVDREDLERRVLERLA